MTPAFQKKFSKWTLRGFSLGEVLLAAFVLTAGLLSVTALISSSLRQSMESRDTIIAVELAQEGIELVRNVRDNDLALGADGFTEFSNSDKHCHFDYNDPAINLSANCTASQGTLSTYYLQYSGGFYAHISTAPSRFSREIFIEKTNAPNISALVRSFVYWDPVNFRPVNIGDSTGCTVANKCVFTEVKLTAWK